MRKKLVISIIILLISTLGVFIFVKQVEHARFEARRDKLIKHSFSLFEEQTALYIKEKYTGISKIEFSPIFFEEGGPNDYLSIQVVPVIYDQEGNKAYLGRKVGKTSFLSYGLHFGVEFDFGIDNEEIIVLENSKAGGDIDVSDAKTLPENAKMSKGYGIDDNISALVKDGQLKNVKKKEGGSSQVEIVYNLEIRKEDYRKWR